MVIKLKNRKAAMEMSVGTIVTIVLLLIVLIMGVFLTKKIMCSGIIITDKISEGAMNQVKELFGVNDYGIKCMGEGSQEIKLGDGGRRKIACLANLKNQADYKITVKEIQSLKGTRNIEGWVLDKGWEGTLSPGSETFPILILDIPDDVSETTIKITIEEENLNTQTKKTHTSVIDIVHIGGFTSAIC